MSLSKIKGTAIAIALSLSGLAAVPERLAFSEDFNVFQGKAPANWSTIVTSSDSATAFIRGREGFRLISPSNMFMPLTDPLKDGRVECRIQAYGFNPAQRYGMNINFRQDVERRTAQSIRFFQHPKENQCYISYGTYADNLFKTIEKKPVTIPQDALTRPCDFTVEFEGSHATVTFLDQKVVFDNVGGTVGQVSINRLNFFDSLELTGFKVYGQEETQVTGTKKYRIALPTEPVFTPYFCDVELTEHGSFYEAKMSFSGGSHLTPAGEGSYHSMRAEKMDHPYFKVITAEKTVEYNLLDEALVLVVNEIAPVQCYTVINKRPEWPFQRVVRFKKPLVPFQMAVGAHNMKSREVIELEMDDWETVFTPDGKPLYAGASPETVVTAALLSSPDKKIVSKVPRNSTKVAEAIEFAKRNHFFYPDEKLEFTLRLAGENLPADVEISFANTYLKPLQKLTVQAVAKEEKLGVRTQNIREYHFTLPQQKVGVYHILVKSLDPTINLDRFFAFEVMPENPLDLQAPRVSGLPFMYCALTETRGLRTDAFDPFMAAVRNIPHYVSGTVFLPWYARETNLYDTVHFYGRTYFAWLGSRCLDKWHIAENLDILKKADFAHIGVELQTSSLAMSLYRGRHVKDLIEFAKMTGDKNFDIPKLEKIAGLYRRGNKNTDNTAGLENQSIDAETYRYVVTNWFPQWLDFENKKTAEVIHNKLEELRKDNPKLKFACYGPAPIYTGRYDGPEFARYLSLSQTSPDDVGYLQYEDYPELSNYPESRGSFFLGTLSMAYPNIRIAAEMYGDGVASAGCPDGAVFFAHPPYGIGGNNYIYRTRNRVYEYTYATAFLNNTGFHYWDRYAIQFSASRRQRQEHFLKAWGNTVENMPVRPLRSAAYVFSADSWNANQKGDAHYKALNVEGGENSVVMDAARVRKVSGQLMGFFYETVSNDGLCAGFQLQADALKSLQPSDCDVLVLPPLKGVPKDQQQEIRRLYNAGVSIVCSEEPGELADLFQIKDGGTFVKVNDARGTADFLPGVTDYTTDPCFGGHYVSNGAKVLIDGEVPVLFCATNGKARAYFFNVPPTTATADMLWERFSYGRQVISKLMLGAIREIYARENKVEVQASMGRVLAAETENGFVVTHTNNTDKDQMVELTFRKRKSSNHLVSIDCPYQILQDDSEILKLRFNTIFRSATFIVIE